MKRGYFFSADILVALLIILGGVFLIFSQPHPEPEVDKVRTMSADIMNLFSTLRLNDICWQQHSPSCDCIYTSVALVYCNVNTQVLDPEMNLLEMLTYIYYDDPNGFQKINDIINETVTKSSLIPENYDYSITLTDLSKGQLNITRLYPI